MAGHSRILAWRIPWTGAWWATVHGVEKSRIQLSTHTHSLIYTLPLLSCPSLFSFLFTLISVAFALKNIYYNRAALVASS